MAIASDSLPAGEQANLDGLLEETHRLTQEETPPSWAVQLDRSIRRQRMEAAVHIVRRLAHDFGNILTGILGFSELALEQQIIPGSPLDSYLNEIHRVAQSGAQYTNQLRQLAQRQTTNHGPCHLDKILAEEERGWPDAEVSLQLHLPTDLPAAAMDAEQLRQVLAVVLDNSREAIGGAGVIEISVQTAQVNARQAGELFGAVRPGTHLEIRVADNGSGLTPEAQRLLFAEPFFSTKPRKRGFGLALAYGILSAHGGGLELLRRPEGGTIARLIVPVAPPFVPPQSGGYEGEGALSL